MIQVNSARADAVFADLHSRLVMSKARPPYSVTPHRSSLLMKMMPATLAHDAIANSAAASNISIFILP